VAEKPKNHSRVKCYSCKTAWENYCDLIHVEKAKGKRLIPTSIIGVEDSSVKLFQPEKEETPHSDLIVSVLNSALMTRFNLSTCFATEGGIVKNGRKGYELNNCYDYIGLSADYGGENAERAFDMYEALLLQLFQREMTFGGIKFRRGEILWLEDKPETYSDALILLVGTLTNTCGRAFTKKTLKKMREIQASPFASRFLRGLTDGEVVKYFVHPPNL